MWRSVHVWRLVDVEQDEWGRTCFLCGILKRTDEFHHDVCLDCHDYDQSQCEECYPLSVK